MRKREIFKCGGGKGSKNSYDPQVGAAAQANAALAQRAQDFTEQYYQKYVTPLIEEMIVSSRETRADQGELYDENLTQMRQARERYERLGIPAEDRYYRMVDQYSAPEEQERQAAAAMGDIRAAAGSARAQMTRQMGGLGIDPTSPAALASMRDMGLATAAAEAGAATRARQAAKTLGMQLTSDAANFGRGGQSSILQFGAAAGNNTNAQFGTANAALAGSASGASVPLSGMNLGMQGYGANLNAYSRLQQSAMQQDAAAASGMGQFLGQVGNTVLKGSKMTAFLSDRRLKVDITPLEALDNGLVAYSFRYEGDPKSLLHVGFMADEVEQLYPEAVTVGEDGYKLVDYSKVPL